MNQLASTRDSRPILPPYFHHRDEAVRGALILDGGELKWPPPPPPPPSAAQLQEAENRKAMQEKKDAEAIAAALPKVRGVCGP